MALTPIFEISNIVTYIKLVYKEKIKNIMICAHSQCKQKQTKILQNRICWPQVQIRSVRTYVTSGTLFLLFVQQTCQNIARISSISLVP